MAFCSEEYCTLLFFNIFIIVALVLDLLVFRRKAHVVGFKEALGWSGIWISLALLFNIYVYYALGKEAAVNFFTGYLIEKSLSVDNLFVFLLIFEYFRTPETSLHKVLFWGICGAIISRGVFIFLGVTLVHFFHPIIYIFGLFLIFSGIKLGFEKEKKIHPEKNLIIRAFRYFFSMTPRYVQDRFFVVRQGRLVATPLILVLISIETADIIFAVDSIPAILAITLDPFIVYTSNIFAILGLRALFFVLMGAMKAFQYLHYGIAAILIFVGVKMLLSHFFPISSLVSLGIIFIILVIAITASLFARGRSKK